MKPIYNFRIIGTILPVFFMVSLGAPQNFTNPPLSATAPDGITSEEGSTKPSSNSVVYPLPEIQIKLENGSTFQAEPNSPVVFSQQLNQIELSCTADYPVRWEYLVKNKSIPLLDVVYRRLIRNISEFSNPKRNRFMSLIKLKGLLESQSGKYLCRHYNEKLDNNSYAISSHFDIFIPGNKTFNTISSVSFINKTGAPHVDIHCPVTEPSLHVRLYKLNEKHYMQTKELLWKPIYANYEPTDGFRLLAGLGRDLLGTYNCTADNGLNVIVEVADLSQRELYFSSSPSSALNESCWENSKFVRYIRSQRLECFCKDSFGLFMNENYEFENRRASCSKEKVLSKLEACADWRLTEYFLSSLESEDVCFREPTFKQGQSDGVADSDKSGSRPSLKVNGKTFPAGNHENTSFTMLNITYNGFVDWAGDFMLAICRSDECNLQFNLDGTSEKGSNNNYSSFENLEFLENEPSQTQYFPMAHYQAKWNDLFVNGENIKQVYVFQAHSLSYAWFPYATAEIAWKSQSSSLPSHPELGQRNPFDDSGKMSDSSSSSAYLPHRVSNEVISNYGFFLYTAIPLFYMVLSNLIM